MTLHSVEDPGVALADTVAHLYDAGWMRGRSGNVSMLPSPAPLRLMVTASGVRKDRLEPHHTVTVDGAGIAYPGQQHTPSAEAPVHAAIVAATGAGAVVHVHLHSAVLVAQAWGTSVDLTDLEQLKDLGCPPDGTATWVAIVDNSQDMAELSYRVTQAIDPTVPAIIVRGHGVYVWGNDLSSATSRTESLDWLLTTRLGLRTLDFFTT